VRLEVCDTAVKGAACGEVSWGSSHELLAIRERQAAGDPAGDPAGYESFLAGAYLSWSVPGVQAGLDLQNAKIALEI
jgi:hypothetical protein